VDEDERRLPDALGGPDDQRSPEQLEADAILSRFDWPTEDGQLPLPIENEKIQLNWVLPFTHSLPAERQSETCRGRGEDDYSFRGVLYSGPCRRVELDLHAAEHNLHDALLSSASLPS
jgi:hypothetical protein